MFENDTTKDREFPDPATYEFRGSTPNILSRNETSEIRRNQRPVQAFDGHSFSPLAKYEARPASGPTMSQPAKQVRPKKNGAK